jgi:hypothetical protein
MSYVWVSSDGGKTFTDIPGLPLDAENHDFGDEGDLVLDGADHLYFADLNVVDTTQTRWTVTGLGKFSLDYHSPLTPTAELTDDRPWIAAHGDGHVFFFSNEGDKTTYPLGQNDEGSGPGRYTVYQSYDGGRSYNALGYTLDDSGWCRPQADPAAGSKYVYALCTNDEGKLYSYVSSDDGRTFKRYDVDRYHGADGTQSWPTLAISSDGSELWGLYVDGQNMGSGGIPAKNTLTLYHSVDHGKTWTHRDITPMQGRYEYGWLSLSPNNRKLGLGIYYRPNAKSDWYVYGAIFGRRGTPRLTSLAPKMPVQDAHCPEAPGDLLGSAFNPDGTLNVVWTHNALPSTCGTATLRDIYYARSLTAR